EQAFDRLRTESLALALAHAAPERGAHPREKRLGPSEEVLHRLRVQLGELLEEPRRLLALPFRLAGILLEPADLGHVVDDEHQPLERLPLIPERAVRNLEQPIPAIELPRQVVLHE